MQLVGAHVHKYKSIEDSTPVEFDPQVTVLVGKNESGKSAFLEALHKALSLTEAKYNFVFDYPRKDYIRDRTKFDADKLPEVANLTFQLDKALIDRINKEVFAGTAVLPDGFRFTRTVTYSNAATITLNLDHQAALDALKKQLKNIEHVDEVFKDAARTDDVVSSIEALQLDADHRLTLFAAEWRQRNKNAPANWNLVGWHIFSQYIKPNEPRLLYFDDYQLLTGKINLEQLQARVSGKQLSGADETLLGLLELAGTSLTELNSEEGYEDSKAKLEAIGLTLTAEIFEFWKQNRDLSVEFDIKPDPKDQTPFNSGKNLYIRIKNNRHGVTVPFDQRSKGFIWFFSFLAWFSSVKNRVGTKHDLVLLLDEPGLNLHALAQDDLLSYIETLSEENQIVFSTHSPFMVSSDRLDRVRVVEDRPKEGTKVTSNLEGSTDESLFPLQAALGYSIAQNLFLAKKNVLIEGPADLILLTHMSSALEARGRAGLEDGVLVPVGGLDKIATFVALLGANKLKLVVLHDRAASPHQKLDDLVQQKLIEKKRVLDYSMFRDPANLETDVEDLFPEDLYLDAFNRAYANELKGSIVGAASLGKHPRIVERINQWLKASGVVLLRDGGFNHYRVAQALIPALTGTAIDSVMERFEKLFQTLNAQLK